MRHFSFALLLSLALCFMPVANFAAQTTGLGWDPLHTKVFIVGVLKWKSKDLDSFSVHNRRDKELVNQFSALGVPQSNITYLPNEKATLQAIKTSLARSLQSCSSNDTFVFYYCGHGWLDDDNGKGYFANYDAGDSSASCLAVDDIVKSCKTNFHGSKILFFVDCCRSGALADTLEASKCSFKYGALSASTSGEDSTGNWTFSQALLDSLAGHTYADFNRDGVITFDELGHYIKDEMKLLEGQMASVVKANGFDPQMKLANVVFRQESVPERVEVKFEGDLWKAKLLERRDKKARVQWIQIGWDAPDDEVWVPLADVRPLKSGTARGTATDSAASTSTPTVNQKVTVLWEAEYYPAVIKKVDGSRYFVHYDEYDSSNDEWVGMDRIKMKQTAKAIATPAKQPTQPKQTAQTKPPVQRSTATPSGTAKFAIKQKVLVLSEDEYYPAVIQKINGNKYHIHYDGYEASDDEWVGTDRIKIGK